MRKGARGFTLFEMMVVVAIIGVLSAIAFDAMRRSRPRVSFNGLSAELQSLVHGARQEAMGAGVPVLVLVYPEYAHGDSVGRIVVVKDSSDPAASLLNMNAPLNLDNYAVATPAAPGSGATAGKVFSVLDLPPKVQVGPADGSGQANLPYPWDSIAINVDCGFCGDDRTKGQAIVFDGRGQGTFYNVAAGKIVKAAGTATGASLTIYAAELTNGSKNSKSTLIVTSKGMLRTIRND